ncbi:MAG: undecaprenyldiphospho-muramoylpentapeptide beta-N-acetylglucosaminyltransferase [Candidatus Saccharimonadales bacterium]
MTGAGSGGHITPILAVADEVKRLKPGSKIIYIGHDNDNLGDVLKDCKSIDSFYKIKAGKFRRYHGEGIKQLLDIKTLIWNIRDFFYLFYGLLQSFLLLRRLKPNSVFIKGGFVGVPIGLSAAVLKIPFITHDSDAMPGLANRIVGRWATRHAVALPKEVYNYPSAKTVTTGIPLRQDFVPVTDKLKAEYRKILGYPEASKIIFVIGGGLGSYNINSSFIETVPHLLDEFKELFIVHIVGRANLNYVEKEYDKSLSKPQQGRVQVYGYLQDIYRYSGAADVIITRAGATNLAEFSLQAKACIVIPSSFLSGGHQLKNADYLTAKQAAIILNEDLIINDSNKLAASISCLLKDHKRRHILEQKLATFAQPEATYKLAELILEHSE